MNVMIEPETLRELLDYDPETGDLTWRHRSMKYFKAERHRKAWNTRYAGKPAMRTRDDGYRQVRILGKGFYGHRVAWAIHYGSWPESQIDHVNGVRDDNRVDNLRDVNSQENNRNMAIRSDNKSSIMGVSWYKARKKWRAQIRADEKQRHLGYFNCITAAAVARKAAEIKYGFHAGHGKELSIRGDQPRHPLRT